MAPVRPARYAPLTLVIQGWVDLPLVTGSLTNKRVEGAVELRPPPPLTTAVFLTAVFRFVLPEGPAGHKATSYEQGTSAKREQRRDATAGCG